jgi:dihydroneopterin aldolase
VIAERLASQFGAEGVTVKASKPEPPIPLPVDEVSVEVWREDRD